MGSQSQFKTESTHSQKKVVITTIHHVSTFRTRILLRPRILGQLRQSQRPKSRCWTLRSRRHSLANLVQRPPKRPGPHRRLFCQLFSKNRRSRTSRVERKNRPASL